MPQDGSKSLNRQDRAPAPLQIAPKRGQPTLYNSELAKEVCLRIAHGRTLAQVCEDDDMPCRDTVYEWRLNRPDFSDMLSSAREASTEPMVDQSLDIARNAANDIIYDSHGRPIPNMTAVKRAELQIGLNQWLMGKWSKRYADKQTIDMNITGNIELSAKIDNAIKRLEATTIDVTADTVSATHPAQVTDKSSK